MTKNIIKMCILVFNKKNKAIQNFKTSKFQKVKKNNNREVLLLLKINLSYFKGQQKYKNIFVKVIKLPD